MRVVYSVIFHNLVLKLTALALAVLTWSYIVGQMYEQLPHGRFGASPVINIQDKNVIVKRLPVHVNLIGTPEVRYVVAIDRIDINPSECVVTGPLESIENLAFVTTEPVSVEGLSKSTRQKVKVKQPEGCEISEERQFFVTVPIVRKRFIR